MRLGAISVNNLSVKRSFFSRHVEMTSHNVKTTLLFNWSYINKILRILVVKQGAISVNMVSGTKESFDV